MSVYVIVKETKGFSIKKDGLKVSYNGITLRAYPRQPIAILQFSEYANSPLSKYEFNVAADSITVGGVLFAGTATQLIDSLRDTILF